MKISKRIIFLFLMMSLISSPLLAQGVQNIEVHGYAQNRFWFNPSSTARFAVERVSLSASAMLPENRKAYIEYYFNPNVPPNTATNVTNEEFRTYLESAYVDMPVGTGNLRVGKGRQLNFGITPTYPNRKTTQYGILSEAFTQDRIVGAQYAYKKGLFDLGASLYTDNTMGSKGQGAFPGAIPASDIVSHFADRDIPAEISGRLAESLKLGITSGCLQAHISGALGALSQTNLTSTNDFTGGFNSIYNTPNNTNTDHNKYGIDATYAKNNFVAQTEWYQGKFSFVQTTGYSILFGYQPKDKPRAYIRYAAINNDQAPNANPLTWDIEQLTFGFVKPISKGIWVELNYERNMERPGGGASSLDNDLLFAELFTGF